MQEDAQAKLAYYAKDFRKRIIESKAILRAEGLPTDWESFSEMDVWFLLRRELKHKSIAKFFEVQWRLLDLDELTEPKKVGNK